MNRRYRRMHGVSYHNRTGRRPARPATTASEVEVTLHRSPLAAATLLVVVLVVIMFVIMFWSWSVNAGDPFVPFRVFARFLQDLLDYRSPKVLR